MSEAHEEPLNVYDTAGRPVGEMPRAQAKTSGLAVGAVNVLLVNARGEVLLQRRPKDRENGGLWDKSVGGHVGAGESFEETAVREAGEELFDDPRSPRVQLVMEAGALPRDPMELETGVAFFPASRQLGLRDVRHAPGGGVRNVLYHVAIYLGRTDVPREGFTPQASEIDDLAYLPAAEIDRLLLAHQLAPNMAFLWLTHAARLMALSRA
jgi:8-oxo-dGTP pyrophosphatase MutT (NUDIX family)